MIISDLTQQFGKKNIPQIRPGDSVRVFYKITESGKTRLQTYEGICIAKKHGDTLDGSFTLRKISGGIGVERTFPLHSPLISKIEKVKTRKTHRAKLYFVRDLVGKKAKKAREQKDYKIWEEAVSEEEIAKIEEAKRLAAQTKEEAKEKEKAELDEKFEAAAAAHQAVENPNIKAQISTEAQSPKSK